MAGPLLRGKWPDGDAIPVAVYLTLVRVLREHPVLRDVVKTWRTWTGDVRDAEPPAKGEHPWVRVTPVRSQMSLATDVDYLTTFRIAIEMATEGLCYQDIGNLAGYVCKALAYNRVTGQVEVLRAFQEAGGTMSNYEDSGFAPQNVGVMTGATQGSATAVPELHATAVVSFKMFIPAITNPMG